MKILVFGEIIWDEYPNKAYIGGAPLNFAAHASRLGANCALLSAVGRDANGEKTISEIKKFGIDCSFIRAIDKPTGRCKVTLDKNGKPTFKLETDSAYDYIDYDTDNINKIRAFGADMLYFGTLAQRNSVSGKTLTKILDKCNFKDIFCDINLREGGYTQKSIELCLNKATILKISRDEEVFLTQLGYLPQIEPQNYEERCAALGRYLKEKYTQLKLLILTLDKDGAVIFDINSDKTVYSPPLCVPVISTVGAGDSFCAAFATSFLNGMPLETCLNKAIILSSFVVSKQEAVPDYTVDIFERR